MRCSRSKSVLALLMTATSEMPCSMLKFLLLHQAFHEPSLGNPCSTTYSTTSCSRGPPYSAPDLVSL